MTGQEVRAACRDCGIRFADVRDEYQRLREIDRISIEPLRALWQRVWRGYAWSRGCERFWQVGMRRKFPRAFEGGDYCSIPNFDVCAASIADDPEFLGLIPSDDPAPRLWELLNEDPPRFAAPAELWRDAFDNTLAAVADAAPVPF